MLRNLVFTLNNPLENGGLELCDWLESECSYVVIGCETGESGTFHWQGYTELRKPYRWATITGLAFRWHIERRMGSQAEAIKYSKKDDNYITHGKRREQGSRGDLDRIRRVADEDGMRVVCMVGNLQQIKVAEKYLSYNEIGRSWKPEVTWIWGDSGTGKSKMAREITGEDVYTKNVGTKWWDGYDGHDDVIIDDFRDDWWPVTYMLALLDRYEMIVEYKGGQRQFRAQRIVITSCRAPDMCYRHTNEQITQLTRRIDKVINLVSDVSEVEG